MEIGVKKAVEEDIFSAMAFLNQFEEKMLFIHSTMIYGRV